MKQPYNQRLLKYTSADEAVLSARLDAVRVAVDHPAEKGKAIEEHVRHFVRDLLPSEYGVSSGFIAYHSNSCQKEIPLANDQNHESYEYKYLQSEDVIDLSSQLDIILYDSLRFGPIARLGTCDVFPAEAVYAYIEVKSYLDNAKQKNGKTDLENILLQSKAIRDIKIRQYHVSIPDTYTKTLLVVYPVREAIQIRSFVFALEAKGEIKSPTTLCDRLKEANSSIEGHLSGMYVYGSGFVCSHHTDDPNDPEIGNFRIVEKQHPLAAFKNALYASLYRFPRPDKNWTPAIDRYYKLSPVMVPKVVLDHNKIEKKKYIRIDPSKIYVCE